MTIIQNRCVISGLHDGFPKPSCNLSQAIYAHVISGHVISCHATFGYSLILRLEKRKFESKEELELALNEAAKKCSRCPMGPLPISLGKSLPPEQAPSQIGRTSKIFVSTSDGLCHTQWKGPGEMKKDTYMTSEPAVFGALRSGVILSLEDPARAAVLSYIKCSARENSSDCASSYTVRAAAHHQ
ncbi:hypothetical protein TIFTF001_032719 [Ficus carica]|uniref:Uncharacterized protein n=1 Tax=Ficus carica TaxID=3494 RepID=A0AA88DX75_FICCA|nr:hypothetical protein TIFTF001_032719 [Ficus carica]